MRVLLGHTVAGLTLTYRHDQIRGHRTGSKPLWSATAIHSSAAGEKSRQGDTRIIAEATRPTAKTKNKKMQSKISVRTYQAYPVHIIPNMFQNSQLRSIDEPIPKVGLDYGERSSQDSTWSAGHFSCHYASLLSKYWYRLGSRTRIPGTW